MSELGPHGRLVESIYSWIFKRFRPRRMARFVDAFGVENSTQILDVGGSEFNWSLIPVRPSVTLLNVYNEGAALEFQQYTGKQQERIKYVQGDGCKIPASSKSFDIVYSNSVIEHVGDLEAQKAFASETVRCGVSYYVQTPNRWFPFEPHLFVFFIHWLPRKVLNAFVPYCPMPLLIRASAQQIQDFRRIRLLSARELQQLFPDAEIWRERFFGLTKSLIAARIERPRSTLHRDYSVDATPINAFPGSK